MGAIFIHITTQTNEQKEVNKYYTFYIIQMIMKFLSWKKIAVYKNFIKKKIMTRQDLTEDDDSPSTLTHIFYPCVK